MPIRFAAHTMATPDRSIAEAAALFGRLGYDGIDLIFHENYGCAVSAHTSGKMLRAVLSSVRDVGLSIPCLVPYAKCFNSLNHARWKTAIAEMHACMDVAEQLESRLIRVLPGDPPEAGDDGSSRSMLVETLRDLAERAATMGLGLAIENHMETAITTAAETAELVRDIDHEAVGILYDPANLKVMGESDDEAAFRRQQSWIRHVHLKDSEINRVAGENRALVPGSGVLTQRLLGEGDTDWKNWVKWLVEADYDGFITAEYGTRWFSDTLPDPEVGLAYELSAVKAVIERVRAEG